MFNTIIKKAVDSLAKMLYHNNKENRMQKRRRVMTKDVFDVAKYILCYCKENNIKDCSNKKLQKLLYYIQAWSLAHRSKKMFRQDIEAWLHGPVVANVYHQYKEYGFNPINCENILTETFSMDDRALMDAVLNSYSQYDADYLEMRTHIEQPWREARNNNQRIISKDSMENYYRNILQKYGKKE